MYIGLYIKIIRFTLIVFVVFYVIFYILNINLKIVSYLFIEYYIIIFLLEI